jgi:hypothetical protein
MFKFLFGVIVGMFLIISFPQIKTSFLDSGVRDDIVDRLKEIK